MYSAQFTNKKITVLYNSVEEEKKGLASDLISDLDNVHAAEDVADALRRLGHEVTLFDVNSKTLKLLTKIKTDLFFNLLEGFGELPASFYSIVSYIESFDIPMTGSSAVSGLHTIDKERTKYFLAKSGIPTPNYQLFINDQEALKYNLRYPLITKPNNADCSVGITQDSVVTNYAQLMDRVNAVRDLYKDSTLAEEYISGKEVDVLAVVLGDKINIFPILEADLSNVVGLWKIVDYDRKWSDDGSTPWYKAKPADISPELEAQIKDIVFKIHKIFDIKGYARVDFRISEAGVPYVIDVNVNPGLSKFVGMNNDPHAEAAGLSYEDFMQMIVDSAFIDFERKTSNQTSFLTSSDLVKSL